MNNYAISSLNKFNVTKCSSGVEIIEAIFDANKDKVRTRIIQALMPNISYNYQRGYLAYLKRNSMSLPISFVDNLKKFMPLSSSEVKYLNGIIAIRISSKPETKKHIAVSLKKAFKK
jgi:hypothetical protein